MFLSANLLGIWCNTMDIESCGAAWPFTQEIDQSACSASKQLLLVMHVLDMLLILQRWSEGQGRAMEAGAGGREKRWLYQLGRTAAAIAKERAVCLHCMYMYPGWERE